MFIRDKIRAADQLQVDIKPAAKVFCVSCKEHIGYFKEEILKALAWVCPECGETYVAFDGDKIRVKTDRGYMP